MSEYLFCRSCGTRFSIKGKEVAKCPECGATPELPGEAKCPGCSTLYSSGTSFCANCGRALFKICERCEKRGPADANYCAKCGGKNKDYKIHQAELEAKWAKADASRKRTAQLLKFLRRAFILLAIMGNVLGYIYVVQGGSGHTTHIIVFAVVSVPVSLLVMKMARESG
jgi:ribosomal protein L40E